MYALSRAGDKAAIESHHSQEVQRQATFSIPLHGRPSSRLHVCLAVPPAGDAYIYFDCSRIEHFVHLAFAFLECVCVCVGGGGGRVNFIASSSTSPSLLSMIDLSLKNIITVIGGGVIDTFLLSLLLLSKEPKQHVLYHIITVLQVKKQKN